MPGWWVRGWALSPALGCAVVGEPGQEEGGTLGQGGPVARVGVDNEGWCNGGWCYTRLASFSPLCGNWAKYSLDNLPPPHSQLMKFQERTPLLAQSGWANQSSTSHLTQDLAQNWRGPNQHQGDSNRASVGTYPWAAEKVAAILPL